MKLLKEFNNYIIDYYLLFYLFLILILNQKFFLFFRINLIENEIKK